MDLPHKLYLGLAAVLTGVGLLMVYSASITSRPTNFEQVYLSRQLLAAGVGIVAACWVGTLPADVWRRIAPWAFWAVVVLLVLVLIPGIGVRVKGAQRWVRFAGLSLQPSELAKLTLPLMTCRCLAAYTAPTQQNGNALLGVLWPAAVMVPLVFVEPDLGTAVFLLGGVAVALWLGNWPLRNFVIVGVLLLPALGLLTWLKPYQHRRLLGYLEAWSDFSAAPYQLQQSLVTLGAGGLWGTGLGKGWQKLSFLPEANTDFVFAVVGEELGLPGTLGIVAVWCGLLIVGVRLLSRQPASSFAFQAGLTLLTQLVAQAWLNVAVVTGLVPPKGIAHPLISAGGSSLVASLLTLGVVWSLSRPPHTDRTLSAVEETPA